MVGMAFYSASLVSRGSCGLYNGDVAVRFIFNVEVQFVLYVQRKKGFMFMNFGVYMHVLVCSVP